MRKRIGLDHPDFHYLRKFMETYGQEMGCASPKSRCEQDTIPSEWPRTAKIADAEDWYEHQNEGLGDRFLAAVEAAVNRASRWPNAGSPVTISDDGTIVNRKISTGGFPWTVGYDVVGNTLLVLAVFHQRRRPGYWTARER